MIVFDPDHDTMNHEDTTNSREYHKGRWVYMAAKRQVYWRRGWLRKRVTWTDANGVKHMVRWDVHHEPTPSR
jgi:hypothetical protein